MNGWSPDELAEIGSSEEIGLASRRPDGSLRPFITMWVVRLGDDLYVRSMYGPSNPWYKRAVASREGRIRAGGVQRDVAFEELGSGVDADLHAAYHAKYDRYGSHVVGTVVSEEAARATLRLLPR